MKGRNSQVWDPDLVSVVGSATVAGAGFATVAGAGSATIAGAASAVAIKQKVERKVVNCIFSDLSVKQVLF